jgi:hypothetical protein
MDSGDRSFQPMPAIAVPSLTLVPVMMNRLVKSSRRSQPTGAVDGGHEVQPSSPSHH